MRLVGKFCLGGGGGTLFDKEVEFDYRRGEKGDGGSRGFIVEQEESEGDVWREKVVVTRENADVEEILGLVVNPAAKKKIQERELPWVTIAEKMATRSYDDCRNVWAGQLYY